MSVERYDPQLDIFRAQFAPEATDGELQLFAKVCEHLDLDPFAGQIVLIGRYDSRVSRVVHRHQVTVDGRRVIAARTGRLLRIHGPEWCDQRRFADGKKLPLEWLEVWDDDLNPPYCARTLIYTTDAGLGDYAANGTAKWSEFAQYTTTKSDVLAPLWKRYPSHMLGKVSEAMALRRAFPEVDGLIRRAAASAGWGTRAVDEVTGEILDPVADPDPVAGLSAGYDRVPDSVYDNAPEARVSSPEHAYRYDPKDAEPY